MGTLIFLSVVALLVLAFYRGWFSLSGHNDGDVKMEKITVAVTMDKAKVKEDIAEATSKAKEIGQNIQEEAHAAVSKIEGH